MGNMDYWDIALLAVAGYFATVLLVRLMAGHRDRRVGELQEQIEQEKRAKKKKTPQQRQRPAA
jgi:hypothetical protein